MTEKVNIKRPIRARAARTGESYTAARRHPVGSSENSPPRVVIATAQCVRRPDRRSREQLHESGLAPGARRLGGIGGRAREVTTEITEYQRPWRWADRGIDGPIRAIVAVTVTSLSDGSRSPVTIEQGQGIG